MRVQSADRTVEGREWAMGADQEGAGVAPIAPRDQEGVVVEALPSRLYRVELESKEQIVAHASHEPRRNFVRILIGDRVLVAVSSRNRSRGRIIERRRERRPRGSQ